MMAVTTLKAEADCLNTLLMAEPQVPGGVAGRRRRAGHSRATPPSWPARSYRCGFLAFGTWLEPDDARNARARGRGVAVAREGFAMSVTTLGGRHVDADGRAIGGSAVLRLRDVSGVKHALAELAAKHHQLKSDVEALRTLIDVLPAPVWVRDTAGRLAFANAAYGHARRGARRRRRGGARLELSTAANARSSPTPAAAAAPSPAGCPPSWPAAAASSTCSTSRRRAAPPASASTPPKPNRCGPRSPAWSTRIAAPSTSSPPGSRPSGADSKLVFYNAAYRALWDFRPAFLDSSRPIPPCSTACARPASCRRSANFREWKRQLHEAYQAIEAIEHEWHLPDGRTLRVVTTPNTEGGVTYLVDDVTERLELARRFDALIRVQGETLDNLAEAIAVFGSDGRVRLHNPAFERMWRLSTEALVQRPHIETVIAWCRPAASRRGDLAGAALGP